MRVQVFSSTFTELGPQFTWGVVLGLLAVCVLVWAVAFKRLTPVETRHFKIFAAEQQSQQMER